MRLIRKYQQGDPVIQLPEVEHIFNYSDKRDCKKKQ